jgi:hypothetical protein
MRTNPAVRLVRPYKKTGNIAIDLVGGCINHAERFYRQVEWIELSRWYWNQFVEGVKARDPEIKIDPAGIDFDGTIVRKGSILQLKSLIYQLKRPLSAES